MGSPPSTAAVAHPPSLPYLDATRGAAELRTPELITLQSTSVRRVVNFTFSPAPVSRVRSKWSGGGTWSTMKRHGDRAARADRTPSRAPSAASPPTPLSTSFALVILSMSMASVWNSRPHRRCTLSSDPSSVLTAMNLYSRSVWKRPLWEAPPSLRLMAFPMAQSSGESTDTTMPWSASATACLAPPARTVVR